MVVPYCTCNTCCGTKTHDGDYIEEGKPGRREKRKLSETKFEEHEGSMNEMLTRQQLMGKHCIECRKGKPPSHLFIPLLNIGKFRKFMICKKRHIWDVKEAKHISEIIDKELVIINQHKANRTQNILSGSPNHESEDEKASASDEEEARDTLVHKCVGYLDIEHGKEDQPPTMCNVDCPSLLWFDDGDKTFYFCKGSHMIRYLIHHYGKHGASKTYESPYKKKFLKGRKSADLDKNSMQQLIPSLDNVPPAVVNAMSVNGAFQPVTNLDIQ